MRASKRRLQNMRWEPKMEPWGKILMKRQEKKEKPAKETEMELGVERRKIRGRMLKKCKESRVSTRSMWSRVSRRLKSPWDLAPKKPLRAFREGEGPCPVFSECGYVWR